MKTFGAALLLLVLGLPGVAFAQPVTARPGVSDTITGVDAPPPGMAVAVPAIRPDLVTDYLRAIEAVDMAVEFETRGETRRSLGASKLKIDARWERRPGEPSATLRGMTIVPEGGRLELGGKKINKITIDDRGVMKLDIHRFPDLTVRKITRNANGDIRLHIDWFPDITIKADGGVKLLGFIGLGNVGPSGAMGDVVNNWPPRLEDVVKALQDGGPAGSTRHEGTVRYDLRGRASPMAFPLGPDAGTVRAATDFSVRGAAVLEPDGTLRTIGQNNTMTINMRIGGGQRVNAGPASARLNGGTTSLTGRYGVAIPLGRAENMVLDIDGSLSYAIDGSDVTLNLPTGARLRAGEVDVSGTGRLRGRIAPTSGSVVLRDGTYRLTASGPISVSGLSTRELSVDDLGFEGRVTSEGEFQPAGNGLALRGRASGELTATGPGMIDALAGDARVRGAVREGSRVAFDVPEFSATTAAEPSTGSAVLVESAGRGRVEAGLNLGDLAVASGDNRLAADRARLDADFTIGTARGRGLESATGTARLRLDSDGTLSTRTAGAPAGLPAGELGAPAATTYRIAPGDTLSAIARRHGTTVDALRAANRLTGDLIRAGDTLTIPGGGAAARPAPAPAGPNAVTTTLDRGSEVALDVRSARMGERGLEVDGRVTARVSVTGLEARGGMLQAKILGAARASLETDFSLRPDASGRPVVRTGTFRVPVRIEIHRGSRVQVTIPGKETDVVMDRDGSYAEFTAVVRLDERGLRVDELAAVDVLLVSTGAARFGGNALDIPGEKSIQYTGRMVVLDRGLDFYGDVTVRVRGPADTPIVRIRW
ncbi:MAG: LysM peptidoglycan-binding domain-containing protein [Planctomycetes bacterium]|nr:LysM peptidoglycan-binding domain-containing protein [Planctomycetota bacterium]